MTKRLIIIPRMSGNAHSDWYPWLQQQLESGPHCVFDPILPSNMPSPQSPVLKEWVGRVTEIIGHDPQELARTVLIGHSVGCQAILRSLAMLPENVRVEGVLCVAGWWWVDQSWDILDPWIETPVDLARVRAAAGKCIAVISSNDPFCSNTEANARTWKEKVGAPVVIVPGVQHFNGPHQPAVLKTLLDNFG